MDVKIVDVLPREFIEKNLVLPLFVIRGVLTLAVPEPSNLFLIEEVRSLTNHQVQIVAATTKDIRRMIGGLPNSKVFVLDNIIEDSDNADVTLIEEAIEDISDMAEIAGQSPVIRLVNYILYNAVREGASDIHIEPAERACGSAIASTAACTRPWKCPRTCSRRDQPHQDHGRHGHQRAPPAAGRPRAGHARQAVSWSLRRLPCFSLPRVISALFLTLR